MPLIPAIPRPRQVINAIRRMVVPMTRPVTRDWVPGDIKHVVVIGAGLAGLSAACRLRAAGLDVTVVESESEVGGRCRTERLTSEHGEFFADTGATVLTMPGLVDSALYALGTSPEAVGWAPQRLSPAYHASFSSGRHLDVFSDADTMAHEVSRFATEKYGKNHATQIVSGYRTHRSWIQRMFSAAFENFMAADFDSALDTLSTPSAANDMVDLVELGGFGSLGRRVQRNLHDDELARVFSFQALYAGVPPRKARAVYGLISHMDTSMGVYYPQFGMGDMPDALAKAFTQAGGTIHTNTPVKSIKAVYDRAVGVLLENGENIAADAIVATPDLPVVDQLIGTRRSTAGSNPVWSPSAVVVHGTVPVDVAQQWADTGVAAQHHTISFGKKWDKTFKEITARRGKGKLMSDPSLLITRPAVSAPERRFTGADGKLYEPISVLAPTPNLAAFPADWASMGQAYVRELLGVLEQRGFQRIAESLAIGRVDTPADWAQQGHGAGSPFALAHTVGQTGPFRPANYPVAGLNNVVLAGSSTTPGVGVPTTVLSGGLAARRILGGGSLW